MALREKYSTEGVTLRDRVSVRLLGGFEVRRAEASVHLPLAAQRLLGHLALDGGDGVHRVIAAQRLWPDSKRAVPNLRSALWQARRIHGSTVIECTGSRLRIASDVVVDLPTIVSEARRILRGSENGVDSTSTESMITFLSKDLLPNWSDEWVLVERERWDQVRLHALEATAHDLMSKHRYLAALEAALTAVAIEPIRETAHRTVVEIYIAEGNSACALKHFHHYRQLVQHDLGVTPSRQMTELIRPLVSM